MQRLYARGLGGYATRLERRSSLKLRLSRRPFSRARVLTRDSHEDGPELNRDTAPEAGSRIANQTNILSTQ